MALGKGDLESIKPQVLDLATQLTPNFLSFKEKNMAHPVASLGGPSYVPAADNRQLQAGDVIKFAANWKYPDDYAGYYDDSHKTVIKGRYQVYAITKDAFAFSELDQNEKGRCSGDVVIPKKYLVDAPYQKEKK